MTELTKQVNVQAFRLVLYKRALHPELFSIKGRRTVHYGAYELEAWVLDGAHMLRFEHDLHCAVELLTDQEDGLPERGVVASVPCAGERDHEQPFGDKINYISTVQTETLPVNLYDATYRELVDFGKESEALMHLWPDAHGRRNGSILDTQRHRNEVHVQAYHMLAAIGLVIRSQTIFEIKT